MARVPRLPIGPSNCAPFSNFPESNTSSDRTMQAKSAPAFVEKTHWPMGERFMRLMSRSSLLTVGHGVAALARVGLR